MDITAIREMISKKKIRWSSHCLERMSERDISRDEVKECIESGEIIENYPDDYPHPSCLIMGKTKGKKVLHVVCGTNGEYLYLITSYIPNREHFSEDMKRRK